MGLIFITGKLFHNLTNFYHTTLTCDIRLLMQSFSNEQLPNGPNLGVFLHFRGLIFVTGKLFQNHTNFYHSASTCDIRLFMQSFSNEQSPNGHNLGSFSNEQSPNGHNLGVFLHFRGPIFVTGKLIQNHTNFYHSAPTCDIRLFMQSFSIKQSPNESYEFLPQCSYM
ncbi:hypothetical protein OROMI_006271 [Orobanche minor]